MFVVVVVVIQICRAVYSALEQKNKTKKWLRNQEWPVAGAEVQMMEV